MRIVQALPDAPAVDILVYGGVVASGVAFGTATNYMPISGGKHQLQAVPAGSPAASPVIDTEIDFDSGDADAVATTGLLNEIEAKVFDVDLGDIDASQARIRTINLSSHEP